MDIPPPGPGDAQQPPSGFHPPSPVPAPSPPPDQAATSPYQSPSPYQGRYPSQGQYPAGSPYPYSGPYPGPYGPYRHLPPVNGLAVASLVLGILCFLPGVGLVLGLLALRSIRRKNERGRGLAVAGSVLSSIGVVLLVVSLVTGFAGDVAGGFREGMRDAQRSGGSISLTKGECFDTPGGSLEGMAYDIDKVPCDGKHDAEVFAVYTMSGADYPGDGRVSDEADERCRDSADEYAMDSWAIPREVDVFHFTPSEASWRAGDREVDCLFGTLVDHGSLTGSLRNDASTLDDHQLTYLMADGVQNDAQSLAPEEESVKKDLGGYRTWAGRMSRALSKQSGMLAAHDWPAAAEQAVAVRVRELDAARKEWEKAAAAADADTFEDHSEKADDVLAGDTDVQVRKTLGLATELAGGEGGGSGGSGGGEESGDGGAGAAA